MKDVSDCGKHKTGNILIERFQLIFLFVEDMDLKGNICLTVTRPWNQPPTPQKTKQNARKISPQNEMPGVWRPLTRAVPGNVPKA